MEANSESAAPIPPAQQSNVAVGTDDGGRKRKPEQSTEPEQQQQHQQEQGGDGDARDGGGGRGSRGAKKRDMGRKAWGRQTLDKRSRNTEQQNLRKQQVAEGGDNKNNEAASLPIYATQFTDAEIAADQRRPKKKVAVLLGYSGSGYHGMQLSARERTIEGDLFAAFVAAGAISKANAEDPKKSSLVRCARTDKGVHAAGNIVSLKLIVEDADIVKKINAALTPQIRVWGYVTTNKGFSCYQQCDSRIYEYLIPTHAFLPPHGSTVMGRRLDEFAAANDDVEAYRERQHEVATFWADADEKYIKPILNDLPDDIRKRVEEALMIAPQATISGEGEESNNPTPPAAANTDTTERETTARVDDAIRRIRAAYLLAKKAYRIHPTRLARVGDALASYTGTRNYHNYTIQKVFSDMSAKRHIKSFKISREPLVIGADGNGNGGTEWLSLKVHGQSFMMHQIRKMVAMVALVVRCGTDPVRIIESYREAKIAIPKAPGLGLLLERPLFDTYNRKAVPAREPIDFGRYEAEMEEFKQREIYNRIFQEEEESNGFTNFFNHIDTFGDNHFLYLTSGGIPAASRPMAKGDTKAPSQPQTQQEHDHEQEQGQATATEQKGAGAVMAEVESESEAEVVDNGEDGG